VSDTWAAAFAREHGRPLRVLHIGNIANNAYINAKIQRRVGIEADVVSYDYFHVMGTPEWEDADFIGDPGNHDFPDWWAVDLRGFVRPAWFAQGRMETCRRYLLARRRGESTRAAVLWRTLRLEQWLRGRTGAVPDVARRAVARTGQIRHKLLPRVVAALRMVRTQTSRPPVASPTIADGLEARLANRYRKHFPDRSALRPQDYGDYAAIVPGWRELMQEYDVVQAYALDPVLPLLCGVPYAAYEHGTIREIPFEETPRGRLAALSYVEASSVFVTNIDNVSAARRLGVAEAAIVRLPHAVDSARIDGFREANRRIQPGDDLVRIFAPARHDWVDADPSWTKGNDRLLRAFRAVADSSTPCRLTLVSWGRDLNASRRLISDLDLGNYVEWLPTLRKDALWREYLRSHAIADQFSLPAFGGVTVEALALGRRVITSLSRSLAEDFFGAAPPLLAAGTEEEIEQAIRAVVDDPRDTAGIGAAANEWFRDYHSSERILQLELEAYQGILAQTSGAQNSELVPEA
jgi:glycosyltransferase involved in cell wall biosynthesis